MPTQVMRGKSGSNPGNLQVETPGLHPGQIAVRQQARKYNFLSAGRGWRKTSLLTDVAVEDSMSGKEVLWTAPVTDQINIGWANIEWAFRNLIQNGRCMPNKTEKIFRFADYGNIIFRSLEEYDNVRGLSPDTIIIDEAGLVRQEGAYYEALRPMLMHRPDMTFWVAGTPKGQNWYWREHMAAQRAFQEYGDKSNSMSWQIPTLGCRIVDGDLIREPHPLENPYVPWQIILEEFQNKSQRTFEQEIMAQFLDDGGGVFRGVQNAVMNANGNWRSQIVPWEPGHSYTVGVDYARKHDFTVITVIRNSDLRQVYWERFNQLSWPTIYDRTCDVCKRYQAPVGIEQVGMAGDIHISELKKRGLTVRPYPLTNKTKANLIDHAVNLIEKTPYRFLMDIPTQTTELQLFQYVSTAAGNLRMEAPKGEGNFDDTVIALSLALVGKDFPMAIGSALELMTWGTSNFADIIPGRW